GCRGGWVVCSLTAGGAVSFEIVGTIRELDAACDLCLIDMPLGLPERGERAVDAAAKRMLGRWHARVFQTPPRCVFDTGDYQAASRSSRHASGKGLSKQMWHIMPKIREVDEAVRLDEELRAVIRECHPEIVFWGLSGSVIAESKKTDDGARLRAAELAKHAHGVEHAVADVLGRFPRSVVGRDDVIDAMGCAVAAAGVWDGTLRTLPDEPERDSFGLAMEMVYRVV
ncbi:MAG: DUF429 domain-containing protein, partial [Planctomycetota bacterium]